MVQTGGELHMQCDVFKVVAFINGGCSTAIGLWVKLGQFFRLYFFFRTGGLQRPARHLLLIGLGVGPLAPRQVVEMLLTSDTTLAAAPLQGKGHVTLSPCHSSSSSLEDELSLMQNGLRAAQSER